MLFASIILARKSITSDRENHIRVWVGKTAFWKRVGKKDSWIGNKKSKSNKKDFEGYCFEVQQKGFLINHKLGPKAKLQEKMFLLVFV